MLSRQGEPSKYSNARLANADLVPTLQKERTWTWYSYMALWMGMTHNIFNYMIVSTLIAAGMNIWQALLTILVGDAILMIPLVLNGIVGDKYGIPFPVFARSAFGVFGANIPALIRGFVAIGWFGVQSYLGSAALNVLLTFTIPAWGNLNASVLGLPLNGMISVLIFWILQGFLSIHGMDVIRKFENWAGPVVLVLMLGLVFWAVGILHGLGPIFHQPSSFNSTGHFLSVFFPSVIAVIGSWASIGLNIPDFTRFSRSTKDQAWGQLLGLPVTTFFFSLMGAFITSATVVAFGKAVWDPVELLKHFHNPWVLIIGATSLTCVTISVNVAANLVSPIYDLIHAFPKKLNFKYAAIISMVIAFAILPWKLLENPDSLYRLMNWAGSFLGPATGILLVDYWVIRKRRLSVDDLYSEQGQYRYMKGFNIRAIVALVLATLLSFIGDFFPSLAEVNKYAWAVGIVFGAALYFVFMRFGKSTNVIKGKEQVSSETA